MNKQNNNIELLAGSGPDRAMPKKLCPKKDLPCDYWMDDQGCTVIVCWMPRKFGSKESGN